MRKLPPLQGFENAPLVSFEQATEPLIAQVPEIKHMVDIIKDNIIEPKNGLSIDGSSSIVLYSMEWSPHGESFYIILNETFRDSKIQWCF